MQYDRRMVMPWLVYNAMMCGLMFLVVMGGAITSFIVTATRISDDLTTVTYGFIIMVSGAIAIGNTGHTFSCSSSFTKCPFRSYKD
jgi:hypothetical protein